MSSTAKKRGAQFGNKNAKGLRIDPAQKRVSLSTTVSQETYDYIYSLRDKMTPGEVIDAAIKLYREIHKDE